jgi:predicted transcriptional regulator
MLRKFYHTSEENDSRTRRGEVLLDKIGFSQKAMVLHLNNLVKRGLIIKEKMKSEELGWIKLTFASTDTNTSTCKRLVNTFKEIIILFWMVVIWNLKDMREL